LKLRALVSLRFQLLLLLKIQDLRSEIRYPGSEIWDQRSEIQYPRSGIRYPRSKSRDLGSDIRDPRSDIWDLRSEIQDPRSKIRDFRLEIKDPRSKIRDLRSEIWDRRSDLISEIGYPRSEIWDPRFKILHDLHDSTRFYTIPESCDTIPESCGIVLLLTRFYTILHDSTRFRNRVTRFLTRFLTRFRNRVRIAESCRAASRHDSSPSQHDSGIVSGIVSESCTRFRNRVESCRIVSAANGIESQYKDYAHTAPESNDLYRISLEFLSPGHYWVGRPGCGCRPWRWWRVAPLAGTGVNLLVGRAVLGGSCWNRVRKNMIFWIRTKPY